MGKTSFNPITTKWRGQIGGFTYRIQKGQQIIGQVASSRKDPKSEKQMQIRMRFKLASQFTKLWDDILRANLIKIENDASKAQNKIRSIAFHASTVENGQAKLLLDNFENKFNASTQQNISPDLELTFTAANQSITVPNGEIVAYQVTAFDQTSTPIGSSMTTFESDGTAHTIFLPRIKGDAKRYDIITFNTTLTNSRSWNGPIGNINGNDPYTIDTKVYSILLSELSDANRIIHGIVTGSYLVS